MSFLDSQRTHVSVFTSLDDDHITRAYTAAALAMLAVFIVVLPAWLLDQRQIEGSTALLKPQKFHVSLALHFATLAVLSQLIPRDTRTSKTLTIVTYLALAALVFETVYILVQAMRSRRSHYNFESSFEITMYSIMGVGAVLLIIVAMVLGFMIWRRSEVSGGLKLGAVLGLILGGVLTLVVAGYMSSSGSRWVGGAHPTGGAEVPFFGWSRETGDLRPPHFFALHMMQSLPIIGWVCDRMKAPSMIIVSGAALIQVAIVAALFAFALSGKPFLPA